MQSLTLFSKIITLRYGQPCHESMDRRQRFVAPVAMMTAAIDTDAAPQIEQQERHRLPAMSRSSDNLPQSYSDSLGDGHGSNPHTLRSVSGEKDSRLVSEVMTAKTRFLSYLVEPRKPQPRALHQTLPGKFSTLTRKCQGL